MPVYPVSSNQFNNHGVNRLFKDLLKTLQKEKNGNYDLKEELIELLPTNLNYDFELIDNKRVNYLSEISDSVRKYHENAKIQSEHAGDVYAIKESIKQITDSNAITVLKEAFKTKWDNLAPETINFLSKWEETKSNLSADEMKYNIIDRDFSINLNTITLSGTKIPKIALPNYDSWKELVRFYYKENLPGSFPYTSVFFHSNAQPKTQNVNLPAKEVLNAQISDSIIYVKTIKPNAYPWHLTE